MFWIFGRQATQRLLYTKEPAGAVPSILIPY